jgi:hypothetical protein
VHFGQVEAQRRFAVAGEREAKRLGAHVRVAVAIAADPVAHAEEGRDLEARQVLLDLGIELGNLAQEGALVVGQRVVDLVGHAELGGAQQPRLPQLRDPRAQVLFVEAALAFGGQRVARAEQLGHRALGIEHALALHLGRVRGQHRRQVGVRQGLGNVAGTHATPCQPLEAHCQRARLHHAAALVALALANVLAVLRQVGEVREIAEGAHHRDCLLDRQVLQQPVQRAAGAGVALEPVGHRQLADALDQLEGGRALLFADHVAEDAPEQADVFDQRAVFFVGAGMVAGVPGCGRHGMSVRRESRARGC